MIPIGTRVQFAYDSYDFYCNTEVEYLGTELLIGEVVDFSGGEECNLKKRNILKIKVGTDFYYINEEDVDVMDVTIDYKLKVMQAFKEGKQIQRRDHLSDIWKDITATEWDWITYEYRIKPEEEISSRSTLLAKDDNEKISKGNIDYKSIAEDLIWRNAGNKETKNQGSCYFKVDNDCLPLFPKGSIHPFLCYSSQIQPSYYHELTWKELCIELKLKGWHTLIPDGHDCKICSKREECKALFKDDIEQERCDGWKNEKK